MNAYCDKLACTILMVKYPEPGTVKSRLALHIGEDHASAVYKLFVTDIIKTIKERNIGLKIAYTPADHLQQFKTWLGEKNEYLPQIGDTLGERLISVFKKAYCGGAKRAIAIASDTPDLPGYIISNALRKLQQADAVIGPCTDGGYYLIGFQASKFAEDVFRLKEWSTCTVLHDTLLKMRESGLRVHELPIWNDVDDINDLREMFERNRNTSNLDSIRYLEENSHILA